MTATAAAFDRYPQFSLSLGEANVYQYFRHRESALVSCLGHDAAVRFCRHPWSYLSGITKRQ